MVMTYKQQTKTGTNPSVKRLLKHLFYWPLNTRKLFPASLCDELSVRITQSEREHVAEIVVVIEGALPLSMAYQYSVAQRAEQVFALYRVWDTPFNSGILFYINVCEHSVTILADRGVHAVVGQEVWQRVCDQVTALFAQRDFERGLMHGIEQLGLALSQFHQKENTGQTNALSNDVYVI